MTSYVVWRRGGLSARWPRRPAVAALGSGAVLVGLAVTALLLGELRLSVAEVGAALVGRGDPLAEYFVVSVRLPRVVTAVAVGAALGLAGSLTQTVTGNPLGSPDVIGFTTGAATGALLVIVLLEGTPTLVSGGALAGGFLTALLVSLLLRGAGADGPRLVLVGLGVAATLSAVNTLLVVRASLVAAQTAGQWLAGSLNAVLWPRALVTSVVVGALAAGLVALARPVSMLALDDDTARGAGVAVHRTRVLAVGAAVGLVVAATAATGPIAFVALAAPQIARRLAGSATLGLGGPAVVGAVLVLGSDLVAQRAFAPTQLAVGVVTGALGGVYLLALLVAEWRRSR